MLTLMAYLPIVALVFLMVKKRPVPSFIALPTIAALTFLMVWTIFKQPALLLTATALQGLLLALTPITIIGSAMLLFKTLEITGGLHTIRAWLNTITDNSIARLMLLGWAFPFLIEGASGFGTPAAIAAPILVGLGFPPVRIAIMILIMNTVPVAFGAVGTPTWFGFSNLHLTAPQMLEMGFKTAILNGLAGLIIPLIALSFVVNSKSIKQNSVFIFLSILSTLIPYVLVARFNYEFPTLVGGIIGLTVTVLLAKYKVGLSAQPVIMHKKVAQNYHNPYTSLAEPEKVALKKFLRASFPIWGSLIILVITRITQLGIKPLLLATHPGITVNAGFLGDFSLSASLVVGLQHILGTSLSWSHSLLYVPGIVPFWLVSALALYQYRVSRVKVYFVINFTLKKLLRPTITLMAALIFVGLMMSGGPQSAVNRIGQSLADALGGSWSYFASFMGALGSFFSGSNTVSNITFGAIQDTIAQTLGLNRTSILALQSAGGSMGAMVSISNIVAVVTVLGLTNQEGYILKNTFKALLAYGLVLAAGALLLQFL